MPAVLRPSTGLTGRISRWQDIEYTPPCLYRLHSRIAPVGSVPNGDGSDPGAFHVEVVYAITPETDHSTHDFWAVARDFALDDESVSKFLAERNRAVVLQDVEALDVLEQVIRSEPAGYQELSINIDAGGLAAHPAATTQPGQTIDQPHPPKLRPVQRLIRRGRRQQLTPDPLPADNTHT